MKNNKVWKTIVEFAAIALGAVLAAFAIEELLVPCMILDGGIVGVSIIISTLTKFPLSILTLILNIPFLLIGSKKLGKMFIIKSAYAMVIFSVSLQVFSKIIDITKEHLLAVCFGGLLLGIGVGLVIRFGGCLDGTEAVAILLNKRYKQLPVGRIVLFFNILIYSCAGILFGFDRAMYSLLTYFITSKVLDIVESGLEQTKAAMIITEDAKTIAEQIYARLGRTVTIMEGEGLVSGEKRVLYCVLTRFEVMELRSIINGVDTSAFVAISDVSEIIGNHIKRSDAKHLKNTEKKAEETDGNPIAPAAILKEIVEKTEDH